MQEKSSRLQAIASFIGLELNAKKTKIMRFNTKSQNQYMYLSSERRYSPRGDVGNKRERVLRGEDPAEQGLISTREYPLLEVPLNKLKPLWN